MEKELPSHGPHGPPSGTSAACDNTSYSYPLTHISQTEDLRFVDNNCEDKESGDLLYYGWSDIGNLDDVDKMLRYTLLNSKFFIYFKYSSSLIMHYFMCAEVVIHHLD